MENIRNINKLYNISGSYDSYNQLIELFKDYKDISFSTIYLSLSRWFGANMSATFGAILDKLEENFNTIEFVHIDQKIERILQKNDFLSYFNFPTIQDNYHTTIRYLKLKPTDGKFFNYYVVNKLLSRDELPKMSDTARNRIAEAIYEIFVNAKIHSESEYIYTCGQFYPQKDTIEFTIVDVGIGFKNRINRRFNSNLNAIQAIKWAIKDKTTTKIGISGGIGLALLKDFIILNKGKMQIISNEGFYQYGIEGEITKSFKSEFPGTVVNLQFRTDDAKSYILPTKIDENNIF